MKIGIETMIQTILLCAGCIMLSQMIASNLYILEARTSFHKLVNQIECSQNDEAVIQSCQKEAAQKGYRLEYQRIQVSQKDSCVLLSLYYQLKVPAVLGKTTAVAKEGVIQGYAR